MKLLVTGATGLLGRSLMRELEGYGRFTVIGTAFTRARAPLTRLDLTDAAAVSEYITAVTPDVIVHTAAERRPDVSQKDPEKTIALNVTATGTLASAARKIGAFFLYMSTDYVFDGTAPPYSPESPVNPLNLYGKSKLGGEKAVWDETPDAAVLRVPILYGEVETLEESPVTMIAKTIMEAAAARSRITIEDWAVRYPTHVDEVARVIREIVLRRAAHPEFNGTFHWSALEPYTKYKMAKAMAPFVGVSEEFISSEDGPPLGAPRPKDSHLDCSLLLSLGFENTVTFAESIEGILKPFLTADRW
ncbi:MAG: SDR family oxidoreductase [Spirochaetes bacterium]|nr:SDR family oxidoreductase [Spirochaetota bacterium]